MYVYVHVCVKIVPDLTHKDVLTSKLLLAIIFKISAIEQAAHVRHEKNSLSIYLLWELKRQIHVTYCGKKLHNGVCR